jgi:hypothetical protein
MSICDRDYTATIQGGSFTTSWCARYNCKYPTGVRHHLCCRSGLDIVCKESFCIFDQDILEIREEVKYLANREIVDREHGRIEKTLRVDQALTVVHEIFEKPLYHELWGWNLDSSFVAYFCQHPVAKYYGMSR